MASAIPSETRLIGVDVAGGLATVDLSGDFLADLGDDTALRVAEVVYTLTQFPTVERVTLLLDSVPVPTIGFDAVRVVDVDRSDFEDQTPAVLVEAPTPGQAVTSPVRVTGTANTFEATVGYEVLDADGAALDDGFTTATSGTGTRGTFDLTVDPPAGPAVLRFFQPSAEDGSPRDVYEVPVTVG
jgi:germination protein M